MAGSLNNIQAEMDAVRRQNLEGLAIQQEMLRREQLQGQLEEFVYNTEKTVAAYSDSKCDDPVTTRYFVLKGIIDTVQQNGISTTIIRGRENKAAFEQALGDVNRLVAVLETEPEVKEALDWLKAERNGSQKANRGSAACRGKSSARGPTSADTRQDSATGGQQGHYLREMVQAEDSLETS